MSNPSSPLPTRTPTARRMRWAVSVVFFCNGAGFASWVSRIPSVREALSLGDGELGSALLALAAGALVAFPLSGRATQWLGARRVTLLSALTFFLMLPQPMWVGSYASLLLVLFLFGAGNGALDVSMNALAVEAETAWDRPIMSSFHGLWSIGGFAGAALGGVAASAGMPAHTHLLLAALLLGTAALAVAPWLPQPRATGPAAALSDSAVPQPRRGFTLPDRVMLGLGCMVFCSFLVEGAMADWSAVYLQDKLGTSASLAAYGYAAFSLAMTVMRLFGDRLTARWGAAPLLRGLNLLGAVALAAALASAQAEATLLALALSGLGIATVVPTVFSAAARREGQQAGRGIATMASFGYTGFLLGPPLIGWLAEASELRLALGLLPLMTLAIVLLLPLLRPTSAASSLPPSSPAAPAAACSSRGEP